MLLERDEQIRVTRTGWEIRVEGTLRSYECPHCGVMAGQHCRDLIRSQHKLIMERSHTARYMLAVADGLVPPLGGGWMKVKSHFRIGGRGGYPDRHGGTPEPLRRTCVRCGATPGQKCFQIRGRVTAEPGSGYPVALKNFHAERKHLPREAPLG